MMRGGGRFLLAIALAVAVLAGCGLPDDETPRDLAADDLPPDLLAPQPAASPTTPDGAATGQPVKIYLLGRERLRGVQRDVTLGAGPAKVIRRLLEGPTRTERRQGMRTAIPDGTTLLASALRNDVLTIDLSNDIDSVQGEQQQAAIAQLVFTATELLDVESVRFKIDGEQTDVPIDDGSLQARPVTRDDYADLRPAP
jgi:spore germination protein GerM